MNVAANFSAIAGAGTVTLVWRKIEPRGHVGGSKAQQQWGMRNRNGPRFQRAKTFWPTQVAWAVLVVGIVVVGIRPARAHDTLVRTRIETKSLCYCGCEGAGGNLCMGGCAPSDDRNLQGRNLQGQNLQGLNLPAAFSCGTKPASSTLQSAPVRGTRSRKHNRIEDARLGKTPMPGGYDQPQQQIIFVYIINKVSIQMVLLGRKYVPHWDKICRSTGAEVISPLGLKNLLNNRPSMKLAMEVRYLTGVVPKLGGQSRLSSRG